MITRPEANSLRRLITALLDWITTRICGPVTPADDGLWF